LRGDEALARSPWGPWRRVVRGTARCTVSGAEDSGGGRLCRGRCPGCPGLSQRGGAESASDPVRFGGSSANDALWKGEVVTSGTTRRRPLMLGRLVLEPQHVGVWQELDPKFCGEVVPSSGQWASSRTPQVLHRVIHRTCGFSSACAQCDGSWNPADDRSEHCATRSYAYPAP